jgi:hypothetical protein
LQPTMTFSAEQYSRPAAVERYEYAHVVKTISATPELYMRDDVKVVSNGLSNSGDAVHFLRLRAGNNDVLSAGWRRTASGIRARKNITSPPKRAESP